MSDDYIDYSDYNTNQLPEYMKTMEEVNAEKERKAALNEFESQNMRAPDPYDDTILEPDIPKEETNESVSKEFSDGNIKEYYEKIKLLVDSYIEYRKLLEELGVKDIKEAIEKLQGDEPSIIEDENNYKTM